MKVKIILNGKPDEASERTTLSDLLAEKKIEVKKIACELNGTIVRRADYLKTQIKDGDQIEILQMIGGG
ncbi:MAG: thiamine biosynthesis protein ThiS [Elusimicrobia bacterium RIFCSPLOWO2_01_FULL_54_10]|nr:MAG: thiamine biosynthesis protein ThiS [Elusimicrobia bacterium RIFCSPLOWO2_01_FULL_54_10]